jgi:hypothetical protein
MGSLKETAGVAGALMEISVGHDNQGLQHEAKRRGGF